MPADSLSIKFGPLCGPIENQLSKQGFRIESTEAFEKLRHSIVMLSLHDYISDALKERLFRKLADEIGEAVEFAQSGGITIAEDDHADA